MLCETALCLILNIIAVYSSRLLYNLGLDLHKNHLVMSRNEQHPLPRPKSYSGLDCNRYSLLIF